MTTHQPHRVTLAIGVPQPLNTTFPRSARSAWPTPAVASASCMRCAGQLVIYLQDVLAMRCGSTNRTLSLNPLTMYDDAMIDSALE